MNTNNILSITIITWALLLLTSCHEQVAQKETDPAALIEEVETRVQAFHTADTSLNAKALTDLLWPEYTMLVDGHYITYSDVKTGSKTFMENTEAFHTQWEELRIIPLGNEHAISSFIFKDSIVAKDGTISRSKGPNTFVWEKRNGQWKLIFGDADHYPVE